MVVGGGRLTHCPCSPPPTHTHGSGIPALSEPEPSLKCKLSEASSLNKGAEWARRPVIWLEGGLPFGGNHAEPPFSLQLELDRDRKTTALTAFKK